MSSPHRDVGAARCPAPCGKVRFLTKKAAKTTIRRMRRRTHDGRLNAYRCGVFWHIGHPPTALTRGRISRQDLQP